MTHGQPDQDPTEAPTIPVPAIGAGSADLQTASDDPAELRRLLQLAQARLAFYESFDRIVGENVRRSGELMLERIGLREQAEAQAAEAARDRIEREAQLKESQQRYRGLLHELMREAGTLRTSLDEMQSRLQDAEAALGHDAPDPPQRAEAGGEAIVPPSAPERHADREPVAPEAVPPADEAANQASPLPERTASLVAMEAGAAAIPSTAPAPALEPGRDPVSASDTWEAPRVVELIAHGVPRAADALSLQRYLGGLDHVAGVEAREFAEGVLRLQVTARAPISAEDIHGWPDRPGARVLHHQPTVIEIDCETATT